MAALNEIAQLAAIEALENAENLPQRRRLLPREPFDELQEHQFVKLYRLTKEAASNLIDTLQPHMQAPSRLSDLSIERKVLTALRFFGSGSYQSDIGCHVNHAVSQASVSRCIEEVSRALNLPGIFNRYAYLPENIQELTRVRNSFYEKHNFLGVAGCVDCTHIAIYPPNINHDMYNEAIYVNRKGYHSINVQLVRHSGYALRPWMMTPVPDAAPGSPEERFNERQEYKIYHREMQCYIINACTVLHNICIDHNIPPVEIGQDVGDHYLGEIDFGMYLPARLDENNPAGRINPELAAGRRVQQIVIRNHFA
ncbi:hypothetical protein NQ314_020960 [Rhamnusium bicolor]|uniref:Nuclease HARBI1 n=1 Tax=Rhamnusium bicolor TaxID=1586634 RepID=A0AAV8WJU5_9CUCU|nr:hypothetical protein NQ314_020960 [Rhamnusium bicolor]